MPVIMTICVAIDDEPLALEVLKIYIAKIPELHLIGSFSDAEEGLAFLQKNTVALLFLDINMPNLNGFELYFALQIKPMIIFTTADKEHAIEAFEIDAIDYLLKPFNFIRFETAITKTYNRKKVKEKEDISAQHLYIHADYKIVKIAFSEIVYIEASDDYVTIYTGIQSYLTLLSMKKILGKLPPMNFLRIHRSYIVAKDKISFLQYRKIGLINNIELPVGDTYRRTISEIKKQD